jgi:DNA/RNA endonuclease YhcR with UshA esterase domain
MRTLKRLSWSMVVVGIAAAAYAQGMRGGGNYNPATEATLTGAVDEVKTMPSPGKGGGGVHFMLNTGTGAMTVHVGPASFVSSKNFTFAKGDTLTVVGSKVTMEGEQVVIAREIKKGDQVLTLRDAKGFPLWSGRGGTE